MLGPPREPEPAEPRDKTRASEAKFTKPETGQFREAEARPAAQPFQLPCEKEGLSTTLPLTAGEGRAEAVEATKGIWPRKSRSAAGWGPRRLRAQPTWAVTRRTPARLTRLHPSVGHPEAQGLLL